MTRMTLIYTDVKNEKLYPFNMLWCVEAIHELLLHLPSLIERIRKIYLNGICENLFAIWQLAST